MHCEVSIFAKDEMLEVLFEGSDAYPRVSFVFLGSFSPGIRNIPSVLAIAMAASRLRLIVYNRYLQSNIPKTGSESSRVNCLESVVDDGSPKRI